MSLCSVLGLGSGGTGTGVRTKTYGKLSKVTLRGGMCNSHRGGAERHEEGEKRVGVRRREGFGACEWNPARGVALRGAWGALWSAARWHCIQADFTDKSDPKIGDVMPMSWVCERECQ